jgi:hypothetical protein
MVQKSHERRGIAVEEIQVGGTDRAVEEVRRRNKSMSRAEREEGYKWKIVPMSTVGAQRLAFGFKRN